MTTLLKMSQDAELGAVTEPSDLGGFREQFESALLGWLDRKQQEAIAEAAETDELTSRLREFVARGGKRLRPALVYFAYRACGGRDSRMVLPLAMSTELLHTYLLIHDDIMDGAALRRGGPSIHATFESEHRRRSWPGRSERHGESVAILLGDLAHSYSVELMLEAQADSPDAGVSRCFAKMCQEVVLGQYLEMTAPFRPAWGEEELLKVLRLKSGRYSVERPIELGALAAGAPGTTLEGLRAYGCALGEAFQLKDDLLGVFGASEAVGKSVDSDIAEGKYTVLVQQTLESCNEPGRKILRDALGNHDVTAEQLREVRRIVERSGAKAKVESMIERRLERATAATKGLDLESEATAFFTGLIQFLRDRQH